MADAPHEWIEVGGRRWCLTCGSFQIRRKGGWQGGFRNCQWRDALIGSWPGYNATDESKHA